VEKRKYYVSVQAGTVLSDQGAAAYELEILATDEEAEHIRMLMDEKREAEDPNYLHSHVPGIPYHHDLVNDVDDYYIQALYEEIYKVGTEETKKFIDSMDIMN